MQLPFAEESPSKTERNQTLYLQVGDKIAKAACRPKGQRPSAGKMEKLLFERNRLRLAIADLFTKR